jgi:hypothetical protein
MALSHKIRMKDDVKSSSPIGCMHNLPIEKMKSYMIGITSFHSCFWFVIFAFLMSGSVKYFYPSFDCFCLNAPRV